MCPYFFVFHDLLSNCLKTPLPKKGDWGSVLWYLLKVLPPPLIEAVSKVGFAIFKLKKIR